MRKMVSNQSDGEHVLNLLSPYIDGEVTAEEACQLESHLQTCALCQRELDYLRQTVAIVRATPRLAPPRAFTLTEAEAARAGRHLTIFGWLRHSWVPRFAGAGSLALILVVCVAVYIFRSGLRMASSQPAAEVARSSSQLPTETAAVEIARELPAEEGALPIAPTATEQTAMKALAPAAPAAGATITPTKPAEVPMALQAAPGASNKEAESLASPLAATTPPEVPTEKGANMADASIKAIENAVVRLDVGKIVITATLPLPAGTPLIAELWRNDSELLPWKPDEKHLPVVREYGQLAFVLLAPPDQPNTELRSQAGNYRIILKNAAFSPPAIGMILFSVDGRP